MARIKALHCYCGIHILLTYQSKLRKIACTFIIYAFITHLKDIVYSVKLIVFFTRTESVFRLIRNCLGSRGNLNVFIYIFVLKIFL